MLLRVDNVWTYYDAIAALQGVSCEVDRGEIVTLIGANGAGKTTILNTICGVTPPRSGNIVYKEQDITRVPTHNIVRMGISHVPEGRRVFPQMTVAENLAMGGFLQNDKAAIAEQLERSFTLFPRLRERRKQQAGTLSGGEQQMLAIGRALMARPELLLLDEPSMGLSPLLVEEVFRALAEVNKMGITMLLVEQNARMALQLADRAYVLETGNVTLAGKAEDLLHDPQVESAYLGL